MCRSADPRFDSAMHSIKVVDQRPLTGDSLAQPRLISQLPYTDSDTSSRFSSKFLFSTSTPTLVSEACAAAGHGVLRRTSRRHQRHLT
jgi:hypothetical protein